MKSYQILMILLILLLTNCIDKNKNKSSGQLEDTSSKVNINQSNTSIFSSTLLNLLNTYISENGKKLDYNKPPLLVLKFSRNNQDQTLSIAFHTSFPVLAPIKTNSNIKLNGMCSLHGIHILIFDEKQEIGYNMYNKLKLNIDSIAFFEEKYKESDNIVYPSWRYKLIENDSVILVNKTEKILLK
ncbi:MAG: hypothetical protein AB9842_06185 [Bacteroidales bacterium]